MIMWRTTQVAITGFQKASARAAIAAAVLAILVPVSVYLAAVVIESSAGD